MRCRSQADSGGDLFAKRRVVRSGYWASRVVQNGSRQSLPVGQQILNGASNARLLPAVFGNQLSADVVDVKPLDIIYAFRDAYSCGVVNTQSADAGVERRSLISATIMNFGNKGTNAARCSYRRCVDILESPVLHPETPPSVLGQFPNMHTLYPIRW